ncbi:MAG: DUF6920 family protein [Thermotogota bacterium]
MEFFSNPTFIKWGVGIAVVVISVVSIFSLGKHNFDKQIDKEIELITNYNNTKKSVVKEEDLENLPKNVQKWLVNVGVVGKPMIKGMYLKQTGEMKLEPEQKYIKPMAEQYINVTKPAYLWTVDLPMIPLINTKGRDLFYEGKGSMKIKLGSLVSVVNEEPNYKLNESSMHRFLLEIPWYPTAALEDYISWEEIDDLRAKAIMNYKGIEVEATYFFNDSGMLLKVEAMRYKGNDESSEREKCVGDLLEVDTVDGFLVPVKINISWITDEEEFTWYKIKTYDIEYTY